MEAAESLGTEAATTSCMRDHQRDRDRYQLRYPWCVSGGSRLPCSSLRDDPVNDFGGRHVELRVRVGDIANNSACWAGDGDDQIIVVALRDTRGEGQHRGLLATRGIEPVAAGEQAVVSGAVLRFPHAEPMFSWSLTRAEIWPGLDAGLSTSERTPSERRALNPSGNICEMFHPPLTYQRSSETS
jgi:hypothetical protein